MVKAIIEIDKEANRVLNIIKAEYGLKDKSQAINRLAKDFGEIILESNMRPEYIKKLKRIEREGTVSLKNFEKKFKVKL